MLMISIPKKDLHLLAAEGCAVRINGCDTVLRRADGYLCYDDNRCKILDELVDGDVVRFAAASHGDEDEPHFLIQPDGTVR